MASTKAAPDSTELTISPEALAAMAAAMSEATLKATRRENDSPPAMNAIGFPVKEMPTLKYKKALFCGAPQDPNRATPDEIRLFNAITTPGVYGPEKGWEVRIKDDEVHVVIHNIHRREVRMELPRSLREILQTIVDEQNAVAA